MACGQALRDQTDSSERLCTSADDVKNFSGFSFLQQVWRGHIDFYGQAAKWMK